MKRPITIFLAFAVLAAAYFIFRKPPATTNSTYTIARCTHSLGLCNLPLFISSEDQLGKQFGVEFEIVNIPNWGDHPAALSSGRVDFSVTPFTNVMTAYANGAAIKVVAGSGLNGLFIVGKSGINTVGELKGKRIGTFQSDTLEMLLYSALNEAGLNYKDVEIVYFTDGLEIVNALATGRIDAMTHVEPFATQAVQKFGGKKLASGKDIWKGDHPDCVLTVSDKVLKENRPLVKGVIRAMLRAQLKIEQNREESVRRVLGKYYKGELQDVVLASEAQPPGVDIRAMGGFMSQRFADLQKLNYIKPEKKPDGLLDLSLLKEVVAEDAEIFNQLKFKAAN